MIAMGFAETVTTRTAWRNDTGNERIYPLREITPKTLEQLQAAVREAERDGCTVRAVGSGHSWSDVALTDGILVQPSGLTEPLDLEPELLRSQAIEALRNQGITLVRVEAGITIAKLNEYLRELKLALPNMGGFDGQTVAGVISTSTHGSGIGYGPLSELVQSLDIVGSGGAVYRVERTGALTDPEAYAARYHEHELKQDDHWFNAAVVGMGCMGLIHSVILGVQPMFYLREVRSMSTWSRVREDLARGEVLTQNAHYEVYFNPYPDRDGEVECLVTTRNPVAPSEYRHDHRRSRSLLMELIARFPLTPLLVNLVVGLRPSLSPLLISQALEALVNRDYVNISYRVFNIGAANYLPAYSCEIGVPVDARERHLAAVEKVVEVANQRRRLGDVYHSSPVSLRFVKATDSYMSMMQGRDTMMIELIMATRTIGGMELLSAHEDALYGLGGRPHWGQLNTLTGSNGLVESMYPRHAEWQEIHSELNASGVFDSPFSKRVGISPVVFDG